MYSITSQKNTERDCKYKSTLSLTAVLEGCGQLRPRSAHFNPENDPAPIAQEAGGPIWTGVENLIPRRDSIHVPSKLLRVAIPNSLSRSAQPCTANLKTAIYFIHKREENEILSRGRVTHYKLITNSCQLFPISYSAPRGLLRKQALNLGNLLLYRTGNFPPFADEITYAIQHKPVYEIIYV